jgi:PKD repeat protein
MRKYILILSILCAAVSTYGNHVRGGEMYYKYKSPGQLPNTSIYTVTLKLYIICNANTGQLENSEPFTVFRKSTNTQFNAVYTAPLTESRQISYDPNSNPCITNPPTDICYLMRFFSTDIELPDDPKGYVISFQRCCRIQGIENVQPPSESVGATYLCEIPGTDILPLPKRNSSPIISGNDAVAICTGSFFTFDFSAIDQDPTADSLVYNLCSAYTGGGQGATPPGCLTCAAPSPAAAPPYNLIPYRGGYSGSIPLGLQATINSKTGVISGIAPNTSAQYVVTVCISEYREGVLINIHRKDIHLRIADCTPLKAVLKPDYSYCDDFTATFFNNQANPAGAMYIWKYGDGTKADTSMDAVGTVQHQFADTGTYKVQLIVILAGQCYDSTTTLAKVYPGFYPGFTVTGSCILNALQFNDTTSTRYGAVNNWRWNFADETTQADTSLIKAPSWKYGTIGIKRVQLIVQSDKGCMDTVYKDVEVKDKPVIGLPFRDTLICSNLPLQDTLQLHATGFGVFTWSPLTRIVAQNTADPFVFPTNTTTYYVQLNENGCINTDSVRVRVVDHVTLDAGPDTTICLTDPVTLRPAGDGLSFTWSPAATLNNPNIKNPVATPTGTTLYTVIARIGKCSVQDMVNIKTVPYPGADAGNNQTVCYRDTAQLNATIAGSSFTWTPTYALSDPNSLSPMAWPLRTTVYVLRAYDTLGCPKPGLDTVIVTVRPPVLAFAGNDTAVVVNQPVKLTATGAELFLWSPPDFLDDVTLQSPTAIFFSNGIYTYAVKAYTPENCFGIDTINVKVFSTAPDIFVPNAFTPGKTRNGVLRPITPGISKLDYFRIYNRWGQLVFASSEASRGWDGRFAGKYQDQGTFVWVVQGRDFTGKVITKKGTVILIR